MLTIRLAKEADLPAMLAIYAPYVEKTTISLEYAVPTAEEFRARYADFTREFPWLVCEAEGAIVGYAYAHKLGSREGWQWSAESTVYVAESFRQGGVGRALYTALTAFLKVQGYWKLYALVTDPNPGSEAFHERLGFAREGHLENAGYKFGHTVGIRYYGLELNTPGLSDTPPTPFPEIPAEIVQKILG